jgi:hypothetical protein
MVNKNKLNGIYVCHHKHSYILCSMFTITRHNYMFRPSLLAIFRLYMNLSISYTNVCAEFTVCGVGFGMRSRFVLEKRVWTGAV